MHGGQEVVLLSLKRTRRGVDARSDELRDAALHELLGELGVFELFADSHASPGPHELREIRIEGMMRKSGEFHRLRLAVGAAGESDAENLARGDGIF